MKETRCDQGTVLGLRASRRQDHFVGESANRGQAGFGAVLKWADFHQENSVFSSQSRRVSSPISLGTWYTYCHFWDKQTTLSQPAPGPRQSPGEAHLWTGSGFLACADAALTEVYLRSVTVASGPLRRTPNVESRNLATSTIPWPPPPSRSPSEEPITWNCLRTRAARQRQPVQPS